MLLVRCLVMFVVVVCCVLSFSDCLVLVVWYVVFVVCYWLLWLLCVVYGLLCVGCCLFVVVRCSLCVVC